MTQKIYTFATPYTTTEDTYAGSWKVAALADDSAHEVTGIVVTIHTTTEENADEDWKPGDLAVDVKLMGYPLTAKGDRAKNRNYGSIYRLDLAEDRWELARAAVMASLIRHGLVADKVQDRCIQPYAEYKAERQASLLKSLGLK